LAREVRVTVQTAAVSKRGRKPGSAPTRAPRKSANAGLTAEEKAEFAAFDRFVDGLELQLQQLNAEMTLVAKRLKG
jgi:hypothetical protein